MGRGNSEVVVPKYFYSSSLFLLLLVLSNSGCKKAEATEIQVVSIEEMRTHLKYNTLQVVDVRSPTDFQESHILSAENIIYNEDFRNNLRSLDREKPVAIYCTSGKISPEAAKILQKTGFKKIYILDGGIKKWVSENQEVISKK